MSNVINFILFQLLWISCIFGVAYQEITPALVVFGIMLIYHCLPKVRKPGDFKIVILCSLLGFVLDSLLAYWQMVDYFYDFGYDNVAPFWIIMLWVGFGLALNHSMSWMFKNVKLAYGFVAIGPALSYFSAQKIGAVVINNTVYSLTIASILWIMVFTVILVTRNNNLRANKYAYR